MTTPAWGGGGSWCCHSTSQLLMHAADTISQPPTMLALSQPRMSCSRKGARRRGTCIKGHF